MILWFNQPDSRQRNAISANRGFHGNIGLFFAVMNKLGGAPFLWWSKILRVRVDFERKEVGLHMAGQKRDIERVITFRELLDLSYPELVRQHMRPFSAAIARNWELPKTAEAIESGADDSAIRQVMAAENGEIRNFDFIALTNILYEGADEAGVPWRDTDLLS